MASIATTVAIVAAGADTSAVAGGAIGLGMSTLTVGGALSTAATVASVAGTVGGAVMAHKSGEAQAADANMRAHQAGLEAGQKQISIRENMMKALSSQNAAAGAGAIGTGGSFGANVNRQISQNQNDLLGLSADTSSTVSQYGAQAQNDVTAGNVKAGMSILDLAGKPGPGATGLYALGNS